MRSVHGLLGLGLALGTDAAPAERERVSFDRPFPELGGRPFDEGQAGHGRRVSVVVRAEVVRKDTSPVFARVLHP